MAKSIIFFCRHFRNFAPKTAGSLGRRNETSQSSGRHVQLFEKLGSAVLQTRRRQNLFIGWLSMVRRPRPRSVRSFARLYTDHRSNGLFRCNNENFVGRSAIIHGWQKEGIKLQAIDDPDVLLWFIWVVQQYSLATTMKEAAARFEEIVTNIIAFIRKTIIRIYSCTTMVYCM